MPNPSKAGGEVTVDQLGAGLCEAGANAARVPTVQRVEKQIRSFEGFEVRFLHLDGRDVRGDLGGILGYSTYRRRAAGTSTVRDWIETRFKPRYQGYDVAVLQGDGTRAHGNTVLKNLLATYP